MICHLLGPVRDALLEEGRLELLLVRGRLGSLRHGLVRQARNVVGLSNQRNLVLVLDHSCHLNRLLEDLEILALEVG